MIAKLDMNLKSPPPMEYRVVGHYTTSAVMDYLVWEAVRLAEHNNLTLEYLPSRIEDVSHEFLTENGHPNPESYLLLTDKTPITQLLGIYASINMLMTKYTLEALNPNMTEQLHQHFNDVITSLDSRLKKEISALQLPAKDDTFALDV